MSGRKQNAAARQDGWPHSEPVVPYVDGAIEDLDRIMVFVQRILALAEMGLHPDGDEWQTLQRDLRSQWASLDTIRDLLIDKGIA